MSGTWQVDDPAAMFPGANSITFETSALSRHIWRNVVTIAHADGGVQRFENECEGKRR